MKRRNTTESEICSFVLFRNKGRFYLSGWARHTGYTPAEWTGSTGRVSSSPRGFPEPAAGDAAAAPR